MSIIAKPFVNMLIANAEEHYLGAEPGELEISPHICSFGPLGPLVVPRYTQIFFLICAINILSQIAHESYVWGRSLNFEAFKPQFLAWIAPSWSVHGVGVCFQRETTWLSAIGLMNLTSSRQVQWCAQCPELHMCRTWRGYKLLCRKTEGFSCRKDTGCGWV